VSKHIRKSANYFKPLPKADPLAERPNEKKSTELGENAIRALLPEWANKPIDTSEDGSPKFPTLPDGHSWEHLLDSEDSENDENSTGVNKRNEKAKGWVATLVSNRESGKAISPQSVVRSDAIRMQRVETRELSGEWGDPLERLRKVGLELAKNHKDVNAPIFQRTKTEGFAANDYPLPGTSFALMGIRGSFGRQQVSVAEVESDRLFHDKADMRHSGVPDLATAPLDAYRARSMKPGERYKVRSERSILAESGMKYTPVVIPGVSSSMIHDLGPSGSVDFTVAVEGETTLEVVRGFGSKIAVCITASDERAEPGDDHKLKASVGAFVDGSIAEYLSKSFGKLAGENVKDELQTLEDRKQNMDLKILPHTEKFNKRAHVGANQHTKNSNSEVTLYEVVFDLSKPKARKMYDQLIGGKDGQQIDFTALSQLPDNCGVQLVSNHVKKASRKGVERTFAAFGYEWWHKGKVEEKSETVYGDPSTGSKLREENHGLCRRSTIPGRAIETTTIGRVKTQVKTDSDSANTGVGVGWRYSIDQKHASPDDLAEMLAFASIAGQDKHAKAQIQELYESKAEIPRRKLLGIKLGKRSVGQTKAEFSVELNVDAVTKLFGHLESPETEKALWKNLATAYATHMNLEQVPDWPMKGLMNDDWQSGLRRNLTVHNNEQNAFLSARAAVNILRKAREATDPVECAKLLGKSFDMLRNDLAMAAGLIETARTEQGGGVDVQFNLEGAEAAKQGNKRSPALAGNVKPQES